MVTIEGPNILISEEIRITKEVEEEAHQKNPIREEIEKAEAGASRKKIKGEKIQNLKSPHPRNQYLLNPPVPTQAVHRLQAVPVVTTIQLKKESSEERNLEQLDEEIEEENNRNKFDIKF